MITGHRTANRSPCCVGWNKDVPFRVRRDSVSARLFCGESISIGGVQQSETAMKQ